MRSLWLDSWLFAGVAGLHAHESLFWSIEAHASVTLIVEVSGDLAHWQSGPGHTETVGDTVNSLVVRDLVPSGGANSKHFLRLRAGLP